MKPFDDLTDEQRANLSGADIDRYIDIECAEAGVQLPPELPPAPVNQLAQPELTVYELPVMAFRDQKDALKIAEIATSLSRVQIEYVNLGPGYRQRVKPVDDGGVHIQPKQVYSDDQANKRSAEIARHEQELHDYKELREKADKIQKARGTIAVNVWSAVNAAKRAANRRTELVDAYARYLELTDNNRRTAARYLEKTYGAEARDLCPELFDFTASDGPDIVRAIGKRAYEAEPEINIVVSPMDSI